MKHLFSNLVLILILAFSFSFVSCSDDDDSSVVTTPFIEINKGVVGEIFSYINKDTNEVFHLLEAKNYIHKVDNYSHMFVNAKDSSLYYYFSLGGKTINYVAFLYENNNTEKLIFNYLKWEKELQDCGLNKKFSATIQTKDLVYHDYENRSSYINGFVENKQNIYYAMEDEKSEDIYAGVHYRTDYDNTLPFIIIGFTDLSIFPSSKIKSFPYPTKLSLIYKK